MFNRFSRSSSSSTLASVYYKIVLLLTSDLIPSSKYQRKGGFQNTSIKSRDQSIINSLSRRKAKIFKLFFHFYSSSLKQFSDNKMIEMNICTTDLPLSQVAVKVKIIYKFIEHCNIGIFNLKISVIICI